MALDRSRFGGCSGISLVELITVVAIFSLLMAVMVPAVDGFRQRQRVGAALRNVSTLLLNTRFMALRANSAGVVEFFPKSCRAFLDNGSESRDWIQQEDEETIDEFFLEPGLTLTDNCNKRTHPHKFRYTGLLRVSPCSIKILEGGEPQGRVVINAVGRVRIENFQ